MSQGWEVALWCRDRGWVAAALGVTSLCYLHALGRIFLLQEGGQGSLRHWCSSRASGNAPFLPSIASAGLSTEPADVPAAPGVPRFCCFSMAERRADSSALAAEIPESSRSSWCVCKQLACASLGLAQPLSVLPGCSCP